MLVDLHAHVLPGLDDGPATLEEALALLGVLAGQGISTVVATPHACDGRHRNSRDRVLRGVAELGAAVARAGLPVAILPGMEVRLGPDAVAMIRCGQAIGINRGRHVLVELPHGEISPGAERALREILMAGYTPIVAHPERNRAVIRDPDRFRTLAQDGVLGMISAGSVLDLLGSRVRQVAAELLGDGSATLLGSNCHDLHRRPPLLPRALRLAVPLGKAGQQAEREILSQSNWQPQDGSDEAIVADLVPGGCPTDPEQRVRSGFGRGIGGGGLW